MNNIPVHLKILFKYNPQKYNFASSLSGCVHRGKSKCCIALPTDAEHARIFEKILLGSFSCKNTQLAFDAEILLEDNKNEKVLFHFNIDKKTGKKNFNK